MSQADLRRGAALALAVLVVLGNGCASVTFKRGASPDAMSSDEKACGGRESADPTAFRNCMKEHGWFVAGHSEEAVAGPTVDEPAANWLAKLRAKATGEPAAAAAAAAVATPAPTTPVMPATSAVVSAPSATVPAVTTAATSAVVAPAAPAAPVAAPAAAPAPAPTPAFDPLAPRKVSSWWKLGASAAAFDGTVEACVSELGVAHRPDPPATTVTAGMAACLRAAGWYGF